MNEEKIDNKETKKTTRTRKATKSTKEKNSSVKPKRTYKKKEPKLEEEIKVEEPAEEVTIDESVEEDGHVFSKEEIERMSSNEESYEISTDFTFNLLEVIIIMLITGVVVSIISGLIVYNNYSKIRNIENVNNTISQKDLNEFTDNYNTIINSYVGEVNESELLDAAIAGMYYYLGDEYSSYIDPNSTETLTSEFNGEYEGVGVEIATLTSEGKNYTIINRVFKDSPADRAGLKAGDVISKLDGTDLSDKDSTYIANYIKNGDKTKFELVIVRDEKEINVSLERKLVVIDSISSEVIDGKTEYIKITTFANNTAKQITDEFDKLDKNVKNLIIDLRDNSGGLLYSAQTVAELFVDKGKNVYQIKDKNDNTSIYKATTPVYRKFDKIVVIINGNSASASEILALALKESCGAKIVGTKSFGKGTVQETKILSSGAMVKYTSSYWLSPNGNSINEKGITPDVVEENADKQLDAAKKAIKK